MRGWGLLWVLGWMALSPAMACATPPGATPPDVVRPQGSGYLLIADVDVLRARYVEAPAGSMDARLYQTLLHEADAYVRQGAPPPLKAGRRGHDKAMMVPALAYVLSGREAYAHQALTYARTVAAPLAEDPLAWMQTDDLSRAELSFGLAMVYNWLSDHLSNEARATLQRALAVWHHLIDEDFHYVTPYPDAGDSGDLAVLLNNHYWFNNAAMALLGYAMAADVPTADQLISRAEANMAQVLRVLPPDGFNPEGVAYAGVGLYALLLYLEARHTARGIPYPGHPFLHEAPKQFIYGTLPNGHQLNLGDTPYTPWWCAEAATMGRLATINADPYAQQRAHDALTACAHGRVNPALTLLFYDDARPRASTDALPLQHHFADAGVVVSRASWEPRAAYLAFKSGPHRVGHDHPDQNTLVLDIDGEHMIVDHGYTYRKRTTDENTLVFKTDLSEATWRGQTREGDPFYYPLAGRSEGLTAWVARYVALDKRYLATTGEAAELYTTFHRVAPTPNLERYRRTVLSVGHRFYVVYDDVRTAGGRPLYLQTRFHTRATATAVVPEHYFLTQGDATLHMLSRHGEGISCAMAPTEVIPQTLPRQPGHVPDVGHPGNGQRKPYVDGQHLACTTKAAVSTAQFLQVLYPGPHPPQVTDTQGPDGLRTLTITAPDHTTHLVFNPTPGDTHAAHSHASDAEVAVVQRDAEGELTLLALHGGQVLDEGETSLVTATQPVELVASFTSSGFEATVQAEKEVDVTLACPSRPTAVEVDGVAVPVVFSGGAVRLGPLAAGGHTVMVRY